MENKPKSIDLDDVDDDYEPDEPLLPRVDPDGLERNNEKWHDPNDSSYLHEKRKPFLHLISSRLPRDFSIRDRIYRLPSLVLSAFIGFLYAFVPQLIRTICFNDPVPAREISATSWMNGLRGISAFIVFNVHFFYMFTYTIVIGWAYRPEDKYIQQLPVFELFADGFTPVIVFFTVAGYVCSYKTLQAVTAGKHEGLFKSLSLSVFRRWFRLYLPVFCSTFCISMLLYVGAFEPTRHYFDRKKKSRIFPGPGDEMPPPRYASLWAQLGYWWSTMMQICNFWVERPKDPVIDVHLWTIPHEFRGSMQLYILLIALGSCRPWIRMFMLGIASYFTVMKFGQWEASCFLYSAILAQYDVMRAQQEKEALTTDTQPPKTIFWWWPTCLTLTKSWRKPVRTCLRTLSYCIVAYITSFPIRGIKNPSPVYKYTVNPLIPARYGPSVGPRFPKQVGILWLMYLLTTVPIEARAKSIWHRVLTSQIATYLGSIMFGFYLVHGMILRSYAYFVPHWVWHAMGGDDSTAKHLFGLFVGYVAGLIGVLWAADVWTREVEGRCVRFAKWLETLLFEKKKEPAVKVETVELAQVQT